MKAIIGLGNPGIQYTRTRHNIGFRLVDEFAMSLGRNRQHQSSMHSHVAKGMREGNRTCMVKPQTYMNHSGTAVKKISDYYNIPIDDILIVHDDIDLAVARLQCKKGGGHGGHNGLRDIINHFATNDFLRIRVGVGRPPKKSMVSDYVLSNFHIDELSLIEEKKKYLFDRMYSFINENLPI